MRTGKWTKATTSTKVRHNLVLIFSLLLCVVNASEESVLATSDSDESDMQIIDAVTADANNENTIDANNNTLHAQEEEPFTTQNDHNHDEDIKSQEPQYGPPSHFRITAHLQTNLRTGHSHFLPPTSLPASFAHLPFLECGAVGATTEGVPLVSGVFRHVPHSPAAGVVRTERREELALEWERSMEVGDARDGDADRVEPGAATELGGGMLDAEEDNNSDETNESNSSSNGSTTIGNRSEGDHPKRPSPPKYVVALSSMQITVGGKNGIHNETQQFEAGDVVFVEDTWWGVWDDFDDNVNPDANGDIVDGRESTAQPQKDDAAAENKLEMKGYVMRASPESQNDLEVLMLTVPASVHRHWQRAAAAAKRADRKRRQRASQSTAATGERKQNGFGTRRPWWKASKRRRPDLPGPCALVGPDPAFAHPSAASATLSQHFAQHFTNLLRRSSDPHRSSFLPHHRHQELFLPILAQTGAALAAAAASLALVLRLWQVIPTPVAVRFGSACVVGMGTLGFVWLGEEVLDQWELWRERRTLEKMMEEGWGGGGGGGPGV